jgi:hypothetical protein
VTNRHFAQQQLLYQQQNLDDIMNSAAGCDAVRDESCLANNKSAVTEGWSGNAQALEIIVVAVFRCLGVIHCFYRFKKIHCIGSSFIMKIAASYLFFVFLIYSLVSIL